MATKHGVVGLTQKATLTSADRGIRINAVGPAFIDTPPLASLDKATYEALATCEKVSELTSFLLSDRARFINGSYHLVDGGYTAG